MKVSVIVPVYNAEKVLYYCVDSILAQSFKDFELILVDDGSTDKSGELCDKYAEQNENITVLHIENGGVSKARNTGIEKAKGLFICFIDSDDFIAQDYLENLLVVKDKFPDYENIWCGFQTVSDYSESGLKTNIVSDNKEISMYNRLEIMALYEKWLLQMPWNKLFITSVIKNNKIRFPEDLSLGEDLLFNLEYIDNTNGKIAIVNKPLNYYLQTGNESLDNKFYPFLFDIYKRINKSILNYLIKWECDKKQLTIFYNFSFYSYEKALRNTFHYKSDIEKKYKYNKQIMKSTEFKTALEKSNCYIYPLYRYAFNHYSYRLVRLLDKLHNLK